MISGRWNLFLVDVFKFLSYSENFYYTKKRTKNFLHEFSGFGHFYHHFMYASGLGLSSSSDFRRSVTNFERPYLRAPWIDLDENKCVVKPQSHTLRKINFQKKIFFQIFFMTIFPNTNFENLSFGDSVHPTQGIHAEPFFQRFT